MPDRQWITAAACGTVLAVNRVSSDDKSFLSRAALDETAHIATTVIALQSVGARDPIFRTAALLSSVLIDLDHLPDTLFGFRGLMGTSPRPYPHSLVTVAAVTLAGLKIPASRRRLVWGVAFGFATHLLRDITDGSSGAPLFWPLRSRAVRLPRHIQTALMLVAIARLPRR